MQLVVDAAVVAGFQTAKEPLLLKLVHHASKPLVVFRGCARKQLANLFREVIIGDFPQVIARITLRARYVVSAPVVIHRAPKELVVYAIALVLSDELLQRRQIAPVFVVFCNHICGDRFTGGVRQQTLQHICGIHAAYRLKKLLAVVRTCLPKGLDILILRKRQFCFLGGKLSENVLELGFQANHGSRERFLQLLVRRTVPERNGDAVSYCILPVGVPNALRRQCGHDIVDFDRTVFALATRTPFLKSLGERLHRIVWLGVFRRKRLPFAQEVAATLHDVVKR